MSCAEHLFTTFHAHIDISRVDSDSCHVDISGRWLERGGGQREEGSLHGRVERDACCCGGGHRSGRWRRAHPLLASARRSQPRE